VLEMNTLLVPVDFSEASKRAFDDAVRLASGSEPAVILLHVIDAGLVEFATSHGLATEEEIVRRMRERADRELSSYGGRAAKKVDVQLVVSIGIPFLEIVKKAEEFQADGIVMGKFGRRGRVEKLLFGTTAEKVIRWATCPIIVIP